MKKIILDMQEMSDSKEIYGQRPNPFISGFIYCLVALLVVAVVYCCVGTIEVVARASGVVRPNDDVSTVSSLLSGRVTSVDFANGQIVRKGEPLLTIDTSETQIVLKNLEATREDCQKKLAMLERFLKGIEKGENPFSDDVDGEEYPYYVEYRNYELAIQNSKEQYQYDAETAASNVRAIEDQIEALEDQIEGWYTYRDSVEQEENLASGYPAYESMYLLYEAAMRKLEEEYQAQVNQIQLDGTNQNIQFYMERYENELADYKTLISSIELDASQFPAGTASVCSLLYEDYCNSMAEYQRSYEKAKEAYEYYLNGGAGNNSAELLAYDKTMLEGYQFFKQSVIDGEDRFDPGKDSVFYRSLYMQYLAEYTPLLQSAQDAMTSYESVLADPEATEEQKAAALTAKAQAEERCSSYQALTLVEINNSILQIKASIAEKEAGMGGASEEYNISTAKMQMESAEAAIRTYKTKVLAEYRQAVAELELKLTELQASISSAKDKETALKELEQSYQTAAEQQYYQTITQIDNKLQTLDAELLSARSNRQKYQIVSEMYRKNVDENGVPLAISMASVEQVSGILTTRDNIQDQLTDVETRLQQTQAQVDQGTVLAERDGVINVMSPIVKGDTLASGATIATIIPLNESEYKVQMYVSNSDIANIEVGARIKYNLAALPSNQYGLVDGYVTSISSDTLVQDGQHSGYYLVEGSIESGTLSDRDGNTGSVSIGMQVEGKIVTQEKTIIRYLLEKIDLF